MRLRHGLLACAGIMMSVAAWLAALAPGMLENNTSLPVIEGAPDEWIRQREKSVHDTRPIKSRVEKRIVWHQDRRNSKTRYAVIYLHGFSATRQEIAPVPREIANALEANLFETRLSGHGHSGRPLDGDTAEDWLADAAEALAVGSTIGDELVVIGTSTGATLALSMLDFPESENISVFVLLAPNFGTGDTKSEFLTWPGGPWLARMVIGEKHSWQPSNDLQGKYWATEYPVAALVEMMRLVKRVRGQLPLKIKAALQVIYSPHDTVIDTRRLLQAFEDIRSPRKELVVLPDPATPANPSMHVLAGDIMAPQNNQVLTARVTQFVLGADSGKRVVRVD